MLAIEVLLRVCSCAPVAEPLLSSTSRALLLQTQGHFSLSCNCRAATCLRGSTASSRRGTCSAGRGGVLSVISRCDYRVHCAGWASSLWATEEWSWRVSAGFVALRAVVRLNSVVSNAAGGGRVRSVGRAAAGAGGARHGCRRAAENSECSGAIRSDHIHCSIAGCSESRWVACSAQRVNLLGLASCCCALYMSMGNSRP